MKCHKNNSVNIYDSEKIELLLGHSEVVQSEAQPRNYFFLPRSTLKKHICWCSCCHGSDYQKSFKKSSKWSQKCSRSKIFTKGTKNVKSAPNWKEWHKFKVTKSLFYVFTPMCGHVRPILVYGLFMVFCGNFIISRQSLRKKYTIVSEFLHALYIYIQKDTNSIKSTNEYK